MDIFTLGPEGSNSHAVAEEVLKLMMLVSDTDNIIFCKSNIETLEMARTGKGIGIVPIENSIGGLVGEVVSDLLHKGNKNMFVFGEAYLPIEHNLLVHKSISNIKQIVEVVSHPQALAQCSNFIREGNLKTRSSLSTAFAAQIAANASIGNIGAIASSLAAKIYGLKILAQDIADFNCNETRFHIVGSCETSLSGNDKTAIIFLLKDKPGALLAALEPVRKSGVNMSSIHSIPLGKMGEYAFYVEFDCHKNDSNGKQIIQHLNGISSSLIVLGSYPQVKRFDGSFKNPIISFSINFKK